MRNYLLLCCTLGLSCAAPQTYSEQAAPLSDDTYATIQEVFGTTIQGRKNRIKGHRGKENQPQVGINSR